jgi:hypothetical protein
MILKYSLTFKQRTLNCLVPLVFWKGIFNFSAGYGKNVAVSVQMRNSLNKRKEIEIKQGISSLNIISAVNSIRIIKVYTVSFTQFSTYSQIL